MQLFVLGVSYKTASVACREVFGVLEQELPQFIAHALQSEATLRGLVVVSTCNRVELYCEADCIEAVQAWWAAFTQTDLPQFLHLSYCYRDADAVRHLMRVASGLDSQVLGEPQILGQLKSSFAAARRLQATTSVLSRLFQHAFAVAKRVRTETLIGVCPVSVAFMAVHLSRQFFKALEQKTALVIGVGDTANLVAEHLRQKQVGRLLIANRTLSRAQQLAQRLGGQAIALSAAKDYIDQADIIVSATASRDPVLDLTALPAANHRQTKLVLDLAVPRDIAINPATAAAQGIQFYTVDDLQEVIDEGKRSRQQSVSAADRVVAEGVSRFEAWYKSLAVSGVISDYRSQVSSLRDDLVAEALQDLKNGQQAEQVIEALGHRLINKMMHNPSVRLRAAAQEGRDELVRCATELLTLN